MSDALVCTPSYCTLHDYPVAAPWCQMAWANASRDSTDLRQYIRDEVKSATDDLYDDLRKDRQQDSWRPRVSLPQKETAKPKPTKPAPVGGYAWNRL